MERADLEHLLEAAGGITHRSDMIVIGSQAILGSRPAAPEALRASSGLDLYPREAPSEAALVEAAIGPGSMFHERFGYYACATGPQTAVLAPAWQERLVRVQNSHTDMVIGWCLSAEDVVVSKLIAGRAKDCAYAHAALAHQVVTAGAVLSLLRAAAAAHDDARRALVRQALGWFQREIASTMSGLARPQRSRPAAARARPAVDRLAGRRLH